MGKVYQGYALRRRERGALVLGINPTCALCLRVAEIPLSRLLYVICGERGNKERTCGPFRYR